MRALTGPILLTIALLAPGIARADPNDVAFDQLQRIYILGAEPPPIGSFDDLRATFELLGPSTTYPPLPGTIAGISRQREGVLLHYSFLGGLERVDDPGALKATIGRPDKDEVDFLDLHAKTYRVVTGDVAKAMLHPNIMQQLSGAANAKPVPGRGGTVALTINVGATPLPTRPFEGTATAGYTVTSAVKATSTGQCPAISANVAVTLYVDATRTEPFVKSASGFDVGDIEKAMGALGCATTMTGAPASPDPALAHFLYYERADTTFTVPALPAPVRSASVLERGHLAALTAADASLFEIPAGFTKVDAPPPASAESASVSRNARER